MLGGKVGTADSRAGRLRLGSVARPRAPRVMATASLCLSSGAVAVSGASRTSVTSDAWRVTAAPVASRTASVCGSSAVRAEVADVG